MRRYDKKMGGYDKKKGPCIHTYRVVVTVIELFIGKQQRVSDEDEDGSQDEGDKQLDVNVVPGTVQLSAEIVRFNQCISH